MADADLLPQLLRQLTQKESAPPPDDNTQINKSIVPNDSMQMDDSNLTVTKYATSAFKWSGMPSVTQMVLNSDFETVTGTATVFSDGLTSGAAWTAIGSFTYSASGATSGASGSILRAGNSAWIPLTGSGGQNLTLTVQATFTTQATLTSSSSLTDLELWQDGNNRYFFRINSTSNMLYLYKYVGGVATALESVSFTPAPSTTYTMTLSKDTNNLLTAKLYSGTGTSTPIGSPLTATDTSLSGGFLIGVGGDTGVVVSGAKVTAPMADGWTSNQTDSGATASFALTIGMNSNYALSINGPASSTNGAWVSNNTKIPVNSSTVYVASMYVKLPSSITGGLSIRIIEWNASNGVVKDNSRQATISAATNGFQRISWTFTTQSTTASITYRINLDGYGTAIADALQFELGTTATPYIRNDSTTQTITRPNAPYVAGGWNWNQGEYKPIGSNKKVYPNDSMSMDDTNGVSVTALNPSTFKWGGNGTKAGWKWNQGQYAQK